LAAIRARNASTPPRSSRWVAERPMDQTRQPRPHRRQGCDLPPNTAWCRNSGRNEIECDCRCRRRARKPSAHHGAVPALSDNWHRNGKRCRCVAGTPCSGTDKPDRVHPWQLLEASRSGIARSVPSTPPNLVWPHLDRSGGLPSSRFEQKGRCRVDQESATDCPNAARGLWECGRPTSRERP
jgi:hypothetical protein